MTVAHGREDLRQLRHSGDWEVTMTTTQPVGDSTVVLIESYAQPVTEFPLISSIDTGLYGMTPYGDALRIDSNFIRHLEATFGIKDAGPFFAGSPHPFIGGVTVKGTVDSPYGGAYQDVNRTIDKFLKDSEITDDQQTLQELYLLIERYPVPIFGSPPEGIETLAALAQKAPFVAFVGVATWTDRPVLAAISGGTAIVIWMAKPAAHVIRRSMAERLADKLGTKTKNKDED